MNIFFSYLKRQVNVRILRLQAPERGQTTLPFGENQHEEEEGRSQNGQ